MGVTALCSRARSRDIVACRHRISPSPGGRQMVAAGFVGFIPYPQGNMG